MKTTPPAKKVNPKAKAKKPFTYDYSFLNDPENFCNKPAFTELPPGHEDPEIGEPPTPPFEHALAVENLEASGSSYILLTLNSSGNAYDDIDAGLYHAERKPGDLEILLHYLVDKLEAARTKTDTKPRLP